MKHIQYRTRGTCSTKIDFDLEDGIIRNVTFTGGCNGNLKGISRLVEGRSAEEIAGLLSAAARIRQRFTAFIADQIAAAFDEFPAKNAARWNGPSPTSRIIPRWPPS